MAGEPEFTIAKIKERKIFVIIFPEIMYYFKEKNEESKDG